MAKVDISSMFLVPKNIYTSMLSRIYEDDVKEEVKSFNRQRDDGNYIEKAINFNQQQERQKNQTFIKPNLMNQTARTNTNTNTDYAPNQTTISDENYHTVYAPNLINQTSRTEEPDIMYQTAKSDENIITNDDNDQSNKYDQTMESAIMTPMKTQAFNKYQSNVGNEDSSTSILQAVASTPISKTTSFIDAKRNNFCNFCRKSFSNRKKLRRHLNRIHLKDMSLSDQSRLDPLPEESEDEDPISESSGAKPKRSKLIKSAVFNPFNIDAPDVTMADQNLLSRTNNQQQQKKKSPQRQSYNLDTVRSIKDDVDDYVNQYEKETYETKSGRIATRYVKKKKK